MLLTVSNCQMFLLTREREQPQRFAQPGSFEFEFGQKWKTLYQLHHEQQEILKRNFDEEASKLDMDEDAARLEQHTIMLRQGLCQILESLSLNKLISTLHSLFVLHLVQ